MIPAGITEGSQQSHKKPEKPVNLKQRDSQDFLCHKAHYDCRAKKSLPASQNFVHKQIIHILPLCIVRGVEGLGFFQETVASLGQMRNIE